MVRSRLVRTTMPLLAAVLVLQLFAGAGAVSAAPPPAPTAWSACFFYTIRFGDTLSSIAFRFGDNVFSLAARNGIANPNFIQAGRVLLVCPVAVPVPSPTFHRVRFGETLSSIARLYGTTPFAIGALNGIFNLNLIFAGQVLRVR